MAANRWTDEFLDKLRNLGDPHADTCYATLVADQEINAAEAVFRRMKTNDVIPPGETFPALAEFFKETDVLPAGTDLERIRRAELIFQEHCYLMALSLLTKSLPEGYAAPNLAIVLNLSGDLRRHPYQRLMSTLQMVLNVTTAEGFQDGGRAVITAQKLRLLHAAIREIVRKYRPDFEAKYGDPANKEDMLGTIIGLSLLVIDGMRTLKAGLTHEQEEDCFYLWRIFAMLMGIHPPYELDNYSFVPDNLDDAALFYAAYCKRHYVDAHENPDGVALAHANVRMLTDLVPKALRWTGIHYLPRMYMYELMGEDMCRRLSIPRVRGHQLLKRVIHYSHMLKNNLPHPPKHHHKRFGMIIFQEMINHSAGGPVTFTIPQNMKDLQRMA